jgi:hypothetical protein
MSLSIHFLKYANGDDQQEFAANVREKQLKWMQIVFLGPLPKNSP